MNCPVCDRSLAPTLSICPACGTMMNDSVGEEVRASIVRRSAVISGSPRAAAERKPLPPRPAVITPPALSKAQTADLVAPVTSPTLVGFQPKLTSIPEWRLQMQNAVQMRREGHVGNSEAGRHFPINGAAALKAERVRPLDPIVEIDDSRVANAMRRIEESRKAFLEPTKPQAKSTAAKAFPPRPFEIVNPTHQPVAGMSPPKMPPVAKPRLVVPSEPRNLEKRDTNKLPKLIDDLVPDEVEEIVETSNRPTEFGEIKRISIKAEHGDSLDVTTGDDPEEIEDLAPFSMRFGAGLFDLIIGVFGSMLLLSPIAFSQGNWFSTTGMITFAVACGVVMFAYMTACLGFFGKTMGMRLFSLELVDAVENEYPTLSQAAVNSSIFILSLPLGGASFVTLLFNEEKRAVHDIVSGTILVKEF